MSTLLLLTSALQPSAEVLPGLALLGHQVRILPAEGSALLEAPDSDLLLVDGRQDLAHARDLCRLIRTTGTDVPVLLVCTEGGLAVVQHDWGMDDVVLHTCGPAELEARIKLAIGRLAARRDADDPESHVIRSGEVVVDDATYTAKVGGRPLDLTFKEFELLKFLAQHPGRVFSRQQLLQEVWGYDYFGGTRTVDVHVRRLRAKLGPENETLIGTVRNVGYRFVLPTKEQGRSRPTPATWSQRPSRARASDGVIGRRCAIAARSTARSTSWAFRSTGTPRARVSTSSMPTRRCPPMDSAASATGRVLRPMPVADQLVTSSGSSATPATSAGAVPGMPPGTPITKSQCTLPPYGRPYLSSSRLQRRAPGRGRTARTPAPPGAPG